MKDYKNLSTNLKQWLQEISDEDNYGLDPSTLYKNIQNSTGDEKQLSQIFEVPIGLVRAIKDENKS